MCFCNSPDDVNVFPKLRVMEIAAGKRDQIGQVQSCSQLSCGRAAQAGVETVNTVGAELSQALLHLISRKGVNCQDQCFNSCQSEKMCDASNGRDVAACRSARIWRDEGYAHRAHYGRKVAVLASVTQDVVENGKSDAYHGDKYRV